MNGQLLHQVYKMCQADHHAMYLSLKDDTAASLGGTLTLKDYLIFLREIKAYVPHPVNQPLNPRSGLCKLM
jgi:hypothetical protein